jgi:hypothetical protein
MAGAVRNGTRALRSHALALTCVYATVLASSGAPGELGAQRADTLTAGARIRIHTGRRNAHEATYVRADSGGLVAVVHPGTPATHAWAGVRRVERYAGPLSPGEAFGRGARRGAVVGGVLTVAAVAVAAYSDLRRPCDCGISTTAVVASVGSLYAGVFAGVGGLVGLAYRDRWQPVRVGPGGGSGPTPAPAPQPTLGIAAAPARPDGGRSEVSAPRVGVAPPDAHDPRGERPAARPPHPAVRPGARVRIEAPAASIIRSSWDVFAVRGDTLLVTPASAPGTRPAAVAFADLERLDVNRGPWRNALVGGGVGLALGAVAGAVYGRSHPDPAATNPHSCFLFCSDEQIQRAREWRAPPSPTFWMLAGVYAGTPAGVLVGRFIVGDRWEGVLPRRARVSVAPATGGGARVAVTVPTR